MTLIDFGLMVVFLILMFCIGWLLRKWINTEEDFMVAGRSLTPFILAATLTAGNINLYSFIGQSGTAYKHGIPIIWQGWTGNMGLVFSGLLIIPILRRLRIHTVPEFVGMRYNHWIRFLVGFYWVFRLSFWLGVVLRAAGQAFMTIAKIDTLPITGNFHFWLLIFAAIAVAYTFLGGMWSVAITNVIQFVLMLGGSLILFPMVMSQVGWMPGMLENLPAGHADLIQVGTKYDWGFILAIWILGIQWASTDQGLLQMSFSSKDARSAAKGLVLSGIVNTPFALLIILPGLAASIILPGITDIDTAFPLLMAQTLPTIIIGLVACGLLSSQMSTISTNLEGVATLYCNDIYKNIFKRNATHKEALFIVRFMIFVAGAAGIVFAYLIPFLGENVVDAYLTIVGVFDMPFFVITIVFGLFWKRANWQGVLIGYLAGVIAGIAVVVHGWPEFNFYASTFIGTGVVLLVTPLASFMFRKPDKEVIDRIWRARHHAEEDDGEPFHIIPKSAPGKFFLGLLLFSLLVFLGGVISAPLGCPYADIVAVSAMVVYFFSGFMRLKFD